MSMIMTLEKNIDEIRIRRAYNHDDFGAFRVNMISVYDMIARTGQGDPRTFTEEELEDKFFEGKSIFRFLSGLAEEYWVAERDEEIVGYARTINTGGLRELTDFFVLPEVQSTGIGKELLRRAFPSGAKHRAIIATTDIPAQALYMKAGLYPHTNIYSFVKSPEARTYQTDLQIVPVQKSNEILNQLAEIDADILDIRRDETHEFLLNEKTCFIYYRDNQPVGYAYVGEMTGPVALLESSDYPAVLAHAENYTAAQDYETFNINVPTTNAAAIRYAMDNEMRLDDFTAVLMLEKPFGRLENYAITVPMYFL